MGNISKKHARHERAKFRILGYPAAVSRQPSSHASVVPCTSVRRVKHKVNKSLRNPCTTAAAAPAVGVV